MQAQHNTCQGRKGKDTDLNTTGWDHGDPGYVQHTLLVGTVGAMVAHSAVLPLRVDVGDLGHTARQELGKHVFAHVLNRYEQPNLTPPRCELVEHNPQSTAAC